MKTISQMIDNAFFEAVQQSGISNEIVKELLPKLQALAAKEIPVDEIGKIIFDYIDEQGRTAL